MRKWIKQYWIPILAGIFYSLFCVFVLMTILFIILNYVAN